MQAVDRRARDDRVTRSGSVVVLHFDQQTRAVRLDVEDASARNELAARQFDGSGGAFLPHHRLLVAAMARPPAAPAPSSRSGTGAWLRGEWGVASVLVIGRIVHRCGHRAIRHHRLAGERALWAPSAPAPLARWPVIWCHRSTKAQKPWLLLTFELPEADGRGGEVNLETPGRMPVIVARRCRRSIRQVAGKCKFSRVGVLVVFGIAPSLWPHCDSLNARVCGIHPLRRTVHEDATT